MPSQTPKNEVIAGTLPWELEPQLTAAWEERWTVLAQSCQQVLESNIYLVEGRTSYVSKSPATGGCLPQTLLGHSPLNFILTLTPFTLPGAKRGRKKKDLEGEGAGEGGVDPDCALHSRSAPANGGVEAELPKTGSS